MNGSFSPKKNSSLRRASQPPLCEGWLEKYALCRGMFIAKGWHRRYVFITNDGIGFCHTNPREKGVYPANRPLRASLAKTFIPFTRRRRGELELEPVYFIGDVSAARHPAVPQHSHNGICSEVVSSSDGGSLNGLAKDLKNTDGAAASHSCTYYYFGLSFEEHRRRYLLLLRTDSPQAYMKWTIVLPLFVNEGSATRLVPAGHPLEAGRPPPLDVNYRRLTDKKKSTLPNSVGFYFDPDPCTAEEYEKVCRMCLDWDEGEREHLFQWAANRIQCMCKQSDDSATDALTTLQEQTEEEHRRDVGHQFDVLGPAVLSYETHHSPHSNEHPLEDSILHSVTRNTSRLMEAVDIMADDVSGANHSKQLSHTFAPNPNLAVPLRKNIQPRPAKSGPYSEISAHGATV
ncbi:hypothetical protein ABB37_05338 [Leptomonas pyrrhocoris]|uniref:PH domain-containing protein n=1 Tax=Leptomonas pyrrhocoris TaxID=157538 RepID=A0A0N0DUX2_LEPPY|nr:hypothetical protein ABB37_05338 [Leptomonas pyrrhocoris]KPA79514.1 hypothetical protein ABB37_05338 [Leptomonas pyrrhocoris]|eukprot:XP_015657953.1 hypothetical protein ABB37_05338 [Leptomonas pyrrhocoris]